MSSYVASYDISHHGRRGQVARILQRYGRRMQRSVFEIWLEPEELPELRRQIGPLLDPTDAFDLFPIDRRHPERRLRWQKSPHPEPVIILDEMVSGFGRVIYNGRGGRLSVRTM
jgi:CRISPR-associated protein Cas2